MTPRTRTRKTTQLREETITVSDFTFSSLSSDEKLLALRNATALGWPHVNDFRTTSGGAQWCALDGVVENATAADDRASRLLDHLKHSLAAHPVGMFANLSQDNHTATTTAG